MDGNAFEEEVSGSGSEAMSDEEGPLPVMMPPTDNRISSSSNSSRTESDVDMVAWSEAMKALALTSDRSEEFGRGTLPVTGTGSQPRHGLPFNREDNPKSKSGTSSDIEADVTSVHSNSSDQASHHSSHTGSEFLEAAEKGDISKVKSSLARLDFDMDKKTRYQSRSALHLACGYGQEGVVEQLLQSGADPVQFSTTGKTPLHEACQGGHTRVLGLLLDYTREVDTQDRDGQSAVHTAAFNGEVGCIKLLNDKGATLVIEDRLNRQPAHLAAIRNHPGVLEYLYEVGVDLECADEQGRNPLHYAAQYGSLDCLVSLIQRDCDITIGDHHGSLPIHYAASHNRLECVRFLVKQGASLEAVQNEGKLVTHMAAHAGSRKVLHWLLSKGLRADTQDNGGNAALHYAAEAGKAECFNCLLHHSALLEIRNKKNLTPLEVAKTKGHPVLIDRAINNEVNCCECKTKSDFNKWERSHSRPCVLRSVTELQKVAYSSPLGPVKKEPTRVLKNAKKRQTKSSTAAVQKDNSSIGDSVFLTEKKVDKLPRRDLAAKFLGEYLPSNEKSDTKY